MITRQLAAFNTATASENKIHDDVTARRFGFSGGLVPGVDVHAYLCWGPARVWGLDWIAHGSMESRYTRPTYDGSTITATFDENTGACRVRDSEGAVLAEGHAAVPNAPAPLPNPQRFAWHPLPQPRPPATATTLGAGRVLGSVDTSFPDDDSRTFLADVREEVDLYTIHRIAHPGWVLRLANRVLKQNVELGPWIHTSSSVQHHALIRDGASVSCRGFVADEYEKSGHRFANLRLAVWADGSPAATISHTAIHRPRQVRQAETQSAE